MPRSPHESMLVIGRAAILQFVGIAISSLAGITTTVALSRRLGYDDLGLYAVAGGLAIIVALLSRLGLDSVAVYVAARGVGSSSLKAQGAAASGFLLVAGLSS